MAELFASGRIIDAILALVALEALLLLALRARLGCGPSASALLGNLASGAALMLGVRAALTGAAWPVVALCLMAALAAHVGEMAVRFLRDDRSGFGRRGKLAWNNRRWRTFGARPPMT